MSSNPAHWFGTVMRRLCSATSIARVREEHEVRTECHGGQISELNARFVNHVQDVTAKVNQKEKKLLG